MRLPLIGKVCAPVIWLAVGCLAPNAWGQGHRGGHMGLGRRAPGRPQAPMHGPNKAGGDKESAIDRVENMSPGERNRVLESLPPQRRKLLEERIERYHQLPPEQRQRLHDQYETFKQLPVERQDAMRKGFKKFSQESPERQQLMRHEYRRLQGMSEEGRKAHLNGEEFRTKFSPREREILEDMTKFSPE